MIHKSAAAVSLGGSFARTGYTTKEICCFLAVFALIAPLGIIIGMSIAEVNKVIDVTFLGLSAGTFVYVACSEIITHEFASKQGRTCKALLVLLGGSLITGLWFFGGHSHGDEGGEHDHDHDHDHSLDDSDHVHSARLLSGIETPLHAESISMAAQVISDDKDRGVVFIACGTGLTITALALVLIPVYKRMAAKTASM